MDTTQTAVKLLAELQAKIVAGMDEHGIPQYMRDGFLDHILYGRGTGHFLRHLFSSNLMQTFKYADMTNQRLIRNYCMVLYNYCPIGSFGSEEQVEKWRKIGGQFGRLKQQLETDARVSKAMGK